MKLVFDFDDSLAIGKIVRVRWTNTGHQYQARAKVVKLNRQTVNVELLEPVYSFYKGTGRNAYPNGQLIQVPRISDIKKWTANNRVEPIEGWSV